VASEEEAEAASAEGAPGEAGRPMKNLLYISLLLLINGQPSTAGGPGDTTRLTMVFAGDIMGHDSQIAAAWYEKDSSYNYHPCFRHIKSFLQQADIAIGNLELTFGGPPYKGYPRFSSPDALAGALREAGFDVLLNANNHVLDRGTAGMLRTAGIMESQHFIHTGSFTDPLLRELEYPLLIEKNNILVGLLNYTYGTNGLEADTPLVVNRIDRELILRDLRKVRSVRPDFVIVTIHWGNEYERTQDESQESLAEFMLANGADAVIGGHPHVIQPVEVYRDPSDTADIKLVAYSLGNFISNQRERYRDGGILFGLTLEKTGKTRICGYSYLPVWVYKPWVQGRRRFELVPASINAQEEAVFGFSEDDLARFREFAGDTRSHLDNVPCSDFYRDYPIEGEHPDHSSR
jgi:hypothetical protein